MKRILNVLIVAKHAHKAAMHLGDDIAVWLQGHNVASQVLEGPGSMLPLADIVAGFDLVLVLGGDGTMLGVARRLVGSNIPVIGINMGKVGFLTSVTATHWKESLARVLAGAMTCSPRLVIQYSVERAGNVITNGFAVNDVVVHRGTLARVITLDVAVEGEHLATLRADGLIISSPIGASGYAVSARGPLMQPTLEAYSLTPICPFLGSFPPFVLEAPMESRIRVREQRSDVHITVDGQEGFALIMDDVLVVKGKPAGLLFGLPEGLDYVTKLRACGFVRDHWHNASLQTPTS